MKNSQLTLIGGVGAVILGLPYIYHAFGPTEAEVVSWGKASFYLGIAMTVFSMVFRNDGSGIAKAILGFGCFALALLQVLPTSLWFIFHGHGISDGTPPSSFVAHWGYSIPHIILLTIGIIGLYRFFRTSSQ